MFDRQYKPTKNAAHCTSCELSKENAVHFIFLAYDGVQCPDSNEVRHNDQFFFTSALSTANLVAIETFFAVIFGIFNINSYLCTAKTVAIATKFAVRIIKGKEIWL